MHSTISWTTQSRQAEFINSRVLLVILIHSREKKRKSLFVNTEEVNKETNSIITEPTPIGKRDMDIPASSLRQKYDQ